MTIQRDSILELILAFRRSKILFTAVRLGIIDALETAPQSAAQLAQALSLHAGALERLLDGCCALGLLERAGDIYKNSAGASRYLVSGSPDTLAGYVTYSDQSLYPLWGHLDDAVRDGSNRWEQTFGGRDSLFDHYFRDPVSTRSFLMGMHGFGQITSEAVARAFDLSRFRHLVDLGGATGHLVLAACRVYPELRGTVLDLPRVEPLAREIISNSDVAGRVSFVTGDFFVDELPTADLYSVGRILHDWDEARIHKLLEKIARSLPSGGGLLIAESILEEDRSGPLFALLQDLNMLIVADGKERSVSGYEALLRTAGFETVSSARTGALADAILAVKS